MKNVHMPLKSRSVMDEYGVAAFSVACYLYPIVFMVNNAVAQSARTFSLFSKLTYYSARKLLDEWCEGDNPKLLKTKRGQEYIYTEL